MMNLHFVGLNTAVHAKSNESGIVCRNASVVILSLTLDKQGRRLHTAMGHSMVTESTKTQVVSAITALIA